MYVGGGRVLRGKPYTTSAISPMLPGSGEGSSVEIAAGGSVTAAALCQGRLSQRGCSSREVYYYAKAYSKTLHWRGANFELLVKSAITRLRGARSASEQPTT